MRPVWSTPTAGRGTSNLNLQNDGNLVLYPTVVKPGVEPWSTRTCGH